MSAGPLSAETGPEYARAARPNARDQAGATWRTNRARRLMPVRMFTWQRRMRSVRTFQSERSEEYVKNFKGQSANVRRRPRDEIPVGFVARGIRESLHDEASRVAPSTCRKSMENRRVRGRPGAVRCPCTTAPRPSFGVRHETQLSINTARDSGFATDIPSPACRSPCHRPGPLDGLPDGGRAQVPCAGEAGEPGSRLASR